MVELQRKLDTPHPRRYTDWHCNESPLFHLFYLNNRNMQVFSHIFFRLLIIKKYFRIAAKKAHKKYFCEVKYEVQKFLEFGRARQNLLRAHRLEGYISILLYILCCKTSSQMSARFVYGCVPNHVPLNNCFHINHKLKLKY